MLDALGAVLGAALAIVKQPSVLAGHHAVRDEVFDDGPRERLEDGVASPPSTSNKTLRMQSAAEGHGAVDIQGQEVRFPSGSSSSRPLRGLPREP